jgi:hypothetical protein
MTVLPSKARPKATMKSALLVAILLAGLLHAVTPAQQPPPDALKFFKNYFVTGDYAVGGVGLRGRGVNGIATGAIHIADDTVPPNADILAAFLYWQVVSTSALGADSGSLPVKFNGYALKSQDANSQDAPFGKLLGLGGTPPCWSSGGTTGGSGGNKLTYTYRADVLRFLDLDDEPTSPGYGKYIVHKDYEVQLPDSGSGNALPIALGASLVVVYRTEGIGTPLSAIVIYDGGYTLNNTNPTMSQRIQGFYQPSATPHAKITHIVGSGQANKSETLLFNGATLGSSPFSASAGESWDNPTFPNPSYSTPLDLAPPPGTDVGTLTTSVSASTDCLTWGAVVFKTEVKDTDNDGLLDVWEDSTSPILDPNGQPLPILRWPDGPSGAGASSTAKDLFVEIGYMKTDADTSYGGVVKPAHTHLPTPEALKLMGDAFRDAPTPINVHFDIWNSRPWLGSPGAGLSVPCSERLRAWRRGDF